MKIGIVGCGILGSAVGERLLDQGFELLVWNRSELRTSRLAQSATRVALPRQVAAAADVTLSFVSGEEANETVYSGNDGLLAADAHGVLVNLSTLSPSFFRDLAAKADSKSRPFVEAPVLGTAAPARNGQLVALVAGDDGVISKVYPVLSEFCRSVRRVGAPGTGAAMKLVHNTILTLFWRATGEAFDFGRASGLSVETMVDVIGDSFAANKQWPLKVAVLLGQKSEVGFKLANLEKELRLQIGQFEQAGVIAPMLELALDRAASAVLQGWGERDVASLALFNTEASK